MGSLADLYRLANFANRHQLASRNKGTTFNGFVRWQFASRAISHPIVLPFVGDTASSSPEACLEQP